MNLIPKKLSNKEKRKLLVSKHIQPDVCFCSYEFENYWKYIYNPDFPVLRQVLFKHGVSPYGNPQPTLVDVLRCGICGKEFFDVPAFA